MTLVDHRKCLFGEVGVNAYQDNVSIRSLKHNLITIKTNKLTYNCFDDKRVVLDEKINTLVHGHHHTKHRSTMFQVGYISKTRYGSNITVKDYGLGKQFQPPRTFPEYEVFPLKVVDGGK